MLARCRMGRVMLKADNPSQERTEAIRNYVSRVKQAASHDAKRYIFFTSIASIVPVDLDGLDIEKRLYRGRADAILGTLVFEFKTNFRKEIADAEEELGRYITSLKADNPRATFTGIATDGICFRVLSPVFGPTGKAERFELVGELDLERERPESAFLWLDSLLCRPRANITPTTEHIVAHLGPASPTFRSTRLALAQLLKRVKEEPAVKVRFDEWRRYLAIVYGEEMGDEALFLRHTYLATLAKLIAFFSLERKSVLLKAEELREVITGLAFQRRGLVNFIEEDFFTWFLFTEVEQEGLELVRRLLHSLSIYDFAEIKQDVLKGLYEELVDPETRHDLGEYYTPDWLAQYILQRIGLAEKPEMSLLDPACGSGTFLFTAIRVVKQCLEERGKGKSEVLGHILENVIGIDIHPLAVIIARTNYLLALQDLLGARAEISVPVYLADAIRPLEVTPIEEAPGYERVYTLHREGKTFGFPESLVEEPRQLDSLIESMRGYLDPSLGDAVVEGYGATVRREALSEVAASALANDFRLLLDLCREGKDTVWVFILKNQPKPLFLSRRKFDAVVGNPPWLSLRYIKNAEYFQWVREQVLKRYKLLQAGKAHLFTHMEVASLFFVRAADLYLKEEGTIGFVMPKSVMVADQHADFTSFHFPISPLGELRLGLKHVADLEGVTPLFRVPACVLVATKGDTTSYPVLGSRVEGTLLAKNVSWVEAKQHLRIQPLKLRRIQGKLFPEDTEERFMGRSYYADKFYEGATIVPRNFWFVQLPSSGLGFDVRKPYLETCEREAALAKKPWDTVRIRGAVEDSFLYATLLGGDVLPFAHLPFRPVVLPIAHPKTVLGWSRQPSLLSSREAVEMGFPGLAAWLAQAEREWDMKAKRDEKGMLKITSPYERLEYRGDVAGQLSGGRYLALYNASGTNISAVVVDREALPPLEVGDARILFQGFVAESKTYYCVSDSIDEANYLAAMLNSSIVDTLIKPTQSRGLWGERDVHKKPLAIAIPRFNRESEAHRALAALSMECHGVAQEAVADLGRRYKSCARIRDELRRLLEDQRHKIDALVLGILEKATG